MITPLMQQMRIRQFTSQELNYVNLPQTLPMTKYNTVSMQQTQVFLTNKDCKQSAGGDCSDGTSMQEQTAPRLFQTVAVVVCVW